MLPLRHAVVSAPRETFTGREDFRSTILLVLPKNCVMSHGYKIRVNVVPCCRRSKLIRPRNHYLFVCPATYVPSLYCLKAYIRTWDRATATRKHAKPGDVRSKTLSLKPPETCSKGLDVRRVGQFQFGVGVTNPTF